MTGITAPTPKKSTNCDNSNNKKELRVPSSNAKSDVLVLCSLEMSSVCVLRIGGGMAYLCCSELLPSSLSSLDGNILYREVCRNSCLFGVFDTRA
jgi:hypothetical protein